MLYHECPNCGSNLDPGERCDCAKEKVAPPIPGLTYIGECAVQEGSGTLPVYEMGGFINTKEGWNLLAKCKNENDMETYRRAKAEWERKQKTAPDAGTSEGDKLVKYDHSYAIKIP